MVTGTGRCGTSAFMRFVGEYRGDDVVSFHETSEPWRNTSNYWNPEANAGIEYVIDRDSSDGDVANSPYILKDTRLCHSLGGILRARILRVDHLFILIRDYRKSAMSRQKRGMWFTDSGPVRCADERKSPLRNQIEFNQRVVGVLMETVAEHDVPHTVLHFPTFMQDGDYLFRKLRGTPLETDRETVGRASGVFDMDQISF